MRDVKLDRDRITIGRRADNDLCLAYPAVSAEHAEIITVGADSFLHDSGSTNGTLVNGSRITKHFLRDRDTIDIGRIRLVYLTNEAETMEPLPAASVEERESDALAQAVGPTAASAIPVSPLAEEVIAVHDAESETVDDLLEDLMQTNTGSSAAVDMPPTVSVVPATRARSIPEPRHEADAGATGGAYIEVMNGPNAGQVTPMTRREFIFGRRDVTLAVIRHDDTGYRLVPIDRRHSPSLNGHLVGPEGAPLAFGDTIEVAGVKLRFGWRTAR